jgi:hypothetical protein
MTIDKLFTLEEQIEILSSVTKIKASYDKNNTSPSHRYYFTELADRYCLPKKIEEEMQDYKWKIVSKENLTTNKSIANLFGIKHYTSVTQYLTKSIATETYEERYKLCTSAGRDKGGESNKTSKKQHILTKEEKSNGGKNGKHKN